MLNPLFGLREKERKEKGRRENERILEFSLIWLKRKNKRREKNKWDSP